MSLLTVNADLTRCADALEKIADCLQKLLPPIYPQPNTTPQKDYPITQVTNADTYEHEIEDQLQWWKDQQVMLMKEYGDDIAAYEESKAKAQAPPNLWGARDTTGPREGKE